MTSTVARPTLRWLARRFRPLAAAATVVGLGLAVWGQREAVGEVDWHVSGWPFVAAVLLFALAPVVQGVSFWVLLRALDAESRLDQSMLTWMRSYLSRYAPTGMLMYVVRIRERRRLGATRTHVITASAYEQLIAVVSGALACVTAFLIDHDDPPLFASAVVLIGLFLLAALRPKWAGNRVQAALGRRGWNLTSIPRGRLLLATVIMNGGAWLATGAGAVVLVHSLQAGPTPSFWWLVGAYAFAWLVGVLLPVLPGGLGIREGALIALLTGPFGAGAATALAVVLRLANTVGEFLAIGSVELHHRLRQRPVPVEG